MPPMGRARGPTGLNTGMAAKRIRREIADLANENLGDIKLAPNESNILQWRATLPGPEGSPYEGGMFEVEIRVPEDYPFSPPELVFLTKVYHCNIASSGAICLDLLKTAWSPALSLYKVILSLSSLLTDPNPADPLVPAIATEYKRNRKKHDQTARDWVKMYAQPKAETVAAPPPAAAVRPAVDRPRPIHRAVANTSAPASVLGTRRAAPSDRSRSGTSGEPISLLDDDDDDVETILRESSSATANGGTAPTRRTKRARVEESAASATPSAAGAGADDVIVIDD